MDSTTIIEAIANGDADGFLDAIIETCRDRTTAMAKTKILMVKPGDKVVFNSHANPKYLRGATATVVRRKDSKLVVTLDKDAGRFKAGRECNAPAEIIDVA